MILNKGDDHCLYDFFYCLIYFLRIFSESVLNFDLSCKPIFLKKTVT